MVDVPGPAAADAGATTGAGKKTADRVRKPVRGLPQPAVLRQTYGMLASGVAVKDDRRTVTFAFDSARMIPAKAIAGAQLVPLAVELSGCRHTIPGCGRIRKNTCG
jgi:hypothetical protein